MEQIPGNLTQTTVAVGGYTAGAGVLNVASTALPFPATDVFRIVVYNNSVIPPEPRGILEVTAVNSATQWAVTAEGADFNANAGDTVNSCISQEAFENLLAQTVAEALAGAYTNVEDEGTPVTQRNTINFTGAGVSVADTGGKTTVTVPGGGGGATSGAAFTPTNNQTGNVVNWQNFSILVALRGESLSAFPTSWKVRMRFTAGSPVIGGMKILRTASRSTTVLDSTTVQIGGISNPTLTTPGLVETDAISLATDSTHDYWFVIFFTNTGANASVGVINLGPILLTTGFVAGDQTGISTIPSLTITTSPYLVYCGINA